MIAAIISVFVIISVILFTSFGSYNIFKRITYSLFASMMYTTIIFGIIEGMKWLNKTIGLFTICIGCIGIYLILSARLEWIDYKSIKDKIEAGELDKYEIEDTWEEESPNIVTVIGKTLVGILAFGYVIYSFLV